MNTEEVLQRSTHEEKEGNEGRDGDENWKTPLYLCPSEGEYPKKKAKLRLGRSVSYLAHIQRYPCPAWLHVPMLVSSGKSIVDPFFGDGSSQ